VIEKPEAVIERRTRSSQKHKKIVLLQYEKRYSNQSRCILSQNCHLYKTQIAAITPSAATTIMSSNENGLAKEDLANPSVVLDKLQKVQALLNKVEEDAAVSASKNANGASKPEMNDWQSAAAMYSLIHWDWEVAKSRPEYRNEQYQFQDAKTKTTYPMLENVAELEELQQYLDYADWAYEESSEKIRDNCQAAGLEMVRHDPASKPGEVSHFIALDKANKVAIVSLKGTSTFDDIMTDLIATPKERTGPHFDQGTFDSQGEGQAADKMSIWCHEGMFTAANWLADNVQPQIENLFLPQGYKIVITGHSLGAGTACLLGIELRSRIPAFQKNTTDLRVLAYATPSVISFAAAKACAPFITAVVNNADIVPRCSLSNWRSVNHLVWFMHEKLQVKGYTMESWTNVSEYYDNEVSKIDDDLIVSIEDMEDFLQTSFFGVEPQPDDLFVPGKIVLVWNKGEQHETSPIGGPLVCSCDMKMLRTIELGPTFISDHSLTSYRENLAKAKEQIG
jgi:hypothetical protein